MATIQNEEDCVGQVKSIFGLYSRFRPQRKDPGVKNTWRHPAIDIPGSRTYRSSNSRQPRDPNDVVSETVTIDAHDLFSQLSTLAYLGKREPVQGLLFSIQEVSEGTIRVWRDWLSKQCESKNWTDGERIAVHQVTSSSPADSSKVRADNGVNFLDPTKDPAILWLNTRDNNLGIKVRVKERKWRRTNNPILYSSDIEIPVSYQIEFQGAKCNHAVV